METPSAALLDLPNELLEHVMSFLTSSELYHVCQVCHRLHNVAQPSLFSAIISWEPDIGGEAERQRKVASLRTALHKNPVHLLRVQIFETDCDDFEVLPDIITSLPNLNTLILRNEDRPDPVFEGASLKVDPAQRTLSSLRSVHLDLFGERLHWSMPRQASVFLLPELRNLFIDNCAPEDFGHDLYWSDHEIASYYKSTALESLRFDHCIIDPDTLKTLLMLPRSLKHLHLRSAEDIYSSWLARDWWTVASYIKSVHSQEESLETLMIQHDLCDQEQLRFDNLTALKEIVLDLEELTLEERENELQLVPGRLLSATLTHIVLWCCCPTDQHESKKSISNAQRLTRLVSEMDVSFPQLKLLTIILHNKYAPNANDLTLPSELESALGNCNVDYHIRTGDRLRDIVSKETIMQRHGIAKSPNGKKPEQEVFILPMSKKSTQFDSRMRSQYERRPYHEYRI